MPIVDKHVSKVVALMIFAQQDITVLKAQAHHCLVLLAHTAIPDYSIHQPNAYHVLRGTTVLPQPPSHTHCYVPLVSIAQVRHPTHLSHVPLAIDALPDQLLLIHALEVNIRMPRVNLLAGRAQQDTIVMAQRSIQLSVQLGIIVLQGPMSVQRMDVHLGHSAIGRVLALHLNVHHVQRDLTVRRQA